MYTLNLRNYFNCTDPIRCHTWFESYLVNNWIACKSVFDEALYKGMLQKGLIPEEQISAIDWDGDNDLIGVESLDCRKCRSLSFSERCIQTGESAVFAKGEAIQCRLVPD